MKKNTIEIILSKIIIILKLLTLPVIFLYNLSLVSIHLICDENGGKKQKKKQKKKKHIYDVKDLSSSMLRQPALVGVFDATYTSNLLLL